ncbi:MAG: hypothetical protein ACREAB_08380 [Blastocatellia bacterium]
MPGTAGNNGSAASISPAVVPATLNPTPTPIARSTPAPQATSSPASKAQPTPTQSAPQIARSSEPTVTGPLAPGTNVKRSARVGGLSLPVILSLLGLVLLALVVVTAKLKRDLRTP